jgi:hypothetical protein
MIAASFILCASWCTSSPSLGAALVPPKQVALSISGGLNVILPTLRLAAVSGLTRFLDLGLEYDVYAGLVHGLALRPRVRLHRYVATSVAVSYSYFTIDELFGVQMSRAPFGNGLGLSPTLHLSRYSRGGVHLSLALGFLLGVLRTGEDGPVVQRVAEASVQHVFAEVSAEWERKYGALFLRFRAVVPVQADFPIIGFLPMFTVGRSFIVP